MIRVIFMVASLKCRWCVCGYTCFAKYTYTSTGRASSLIDHRCKILKSQTALISLVGTHMCFRSNLQQLLPLSFFSGGKLWYGAGLFYRDLFRHVRRRIVFSSHGRNSFYQKEGGKYCLDKVN